jgi:hypothetical protein
MNAKFPLHVGAIGVVLILVLWLLSFLPKVDLQDGRIEMADPITWVYVAVISNGILTGGFSNKEACVGHRGIMKDSKITGQCVELENQGYLTTSSTNNFITGTSQGYCTILSNGQTFCH